MQGWLLDDVDFLVKHGLMTPVAFVSFARLSMLKRLMCAELFPLLALASVAARRPKSWLNAVQQDLKIIAAFSDVFKSSLHWNLAAWIAYIAASPQHYMRSLYKAFTLPAITL